MTEAFDLKTRKAINDPDPIFAAMLAEQPVHYSAGLKGWVVADYHNVKLALTDDRFSVEKMSPFADHMAAGDDAHKIRKLAQVLGGWMVFKDPPAHTRLRQVLQQPFKPREMEKLRGEVIRIANEVAGEMAQQAGEVVDFMAAFANPLPARVIAVLIGVDMAMVPQLTAWSSDIAKFVFSARDTPDKYSRAHGALVEIEAFYREVIADHRARPRDDMLSRMIAHDGGDSGDRGGGAPLTDAEIVSMMILFLFAGHETTANLIANGLVALLANPGQLARLRDDFSLLPGAVEEFLRYQGPVQTIVRIAKEDIELGGHDIKAGDRVFALIGASHHDLSIFKDAQDVDIARVQNPHVAFGFGIHMCIGAPLARIEGQEAFRVLLSRFEDFQLAAGELTWRDDFVTRGLEKLPLTFKLRDN
ncbi:MAG: cytochrome P450 [Alphaproteobacteria bacterium]